MKNVNWKNIYRYVRTLEIKTAELSQTHAGLNLSQFQAAFLFRINSSTATKYIRINIWHYNNINKSKILVLDVNLDFHKRRLCIHYYL